MKPIKLKIKTLNQKHSVIIGLNLISRLSFYIKQNSISFEKCLLVIDKNVPQKMITKIRKTLNKKKIYSLSITASEKNKNQSVCVHCALVRLPHLINIPAQVFMIA